MTKRELIEALEALDLPDDTVVMLWENPPDCLLPVRDVSEWGQDSEKVIWIDT